MGKDIRAGSGDLHSSSPGNLLSSSSASIFSPLSLSYLSLSLSAILTSE